MLSFEIYTERKKGLGGIVSRFFEGFTMIDSIGYWKGQKEDSSIIKIYSDNSESIRELVYAILEENEQEEVILELQNWKKSIEVFFINEDNLNNIFDDIFNGLNIKEDF